MVVITEGAQREAGNEVPIQWSLLRPPLLPAQDAAPNQKKKKTFSDLQLQPCVLGENMKSPASIKRQIGVNENKE